MSVSSCFACRRGDGPWSLHHFDTGGCAGTFSGAAFGLESHPDPDNHSLLITRVPAAADSPDQGEGAALKTKGGHSDEGRGNARQATAAWGAGERQAIQTVRSFDPRATSNEHRKAAQV